MLQASLSYIHPENYITPLTPKTDIPNLCKMSLPQTQSPLKPTWEETDGLCIVERSANYDPVHSMASLVPTHSLFVPPQTKPARLVETPLKRASDNTSTPAKRKRVSLDPEETTECSFSGAEHILRMVDDSLVDTPDKQTTPRIQNAAPVPSPGRAGPTYAYDTREYTQMFGALPPRPAWFQPWSRTLSPVKW